ncbi:MAG: hypothetical protein N5P05_001731 [Chroococcopsis gigantea SAG 12.99]|jgi:CRISPR-associated protein Cmr6|nr:type III-B CRISPR module RAMP protein Cmr6 [Chlorogloea purpurea SAG 13.99]MDV3000125.1 hypothetical protein [Chroococcopsis gigantea SAG 12.99]
MFNTDVPKWKQPASAPKSPKPSQSQPTKSAGHTSHSGGPKKIIIGGSGSGGSGSGSSGGGGSGGSGSGGNNQPPKPSPWLDPETPTPDISASFVEYLRWMRPADDPHKDGTKVEILQKAVDGGNYTRRLDQLKRRTQLLARDGITFQVKSTWRVRVGGHRGPESILLPAFDPSGMPYIPSSTLRGIARTAAIREIMAQKKLEWKDAAKDEKIASYFGDLDTPNKENRSGKVVFFDAYPLPTSPGNNGGLEMDMANNIWKWESDSIRYEPNPNPFLSLKESTFLIGLRLASNCQDRSLLDKVKSWLAQGLKAGVGSQVNTGYGELIEAGKNLQSNLEFYKLEFGLEGQLIHGHQKFTQWRPDNQGRWQMRGAAVAEVRPIAFKSMMRYWFRVFASGVLTPQDVQDIEAKIFGGINPKKYGYLTVKIFDGRVNQTEPRPNQEGRRDPCGEQSGTLVLALSPETPDNRKEAVKSLAKHLTWFLFNMGGIGQGARRPNYSRQNRQQAPWFRGSTFYIDNEEEFWAEPSNIQSAKTQFRQKLKAFYTSLSQIIGANIDHNNLRNLGQVSQRDWREVADSNCRIFVCSGREQNGKPYALSVLHSPQLKIGSDYDGFLCGKVRGGVKPSPVWIADLGKYQIVTVFGATADPRKKFIEKLRNDTAEQDFAQIFPFN